MAKFTQNDDLLPASEVSYHVIDGLDRLLLRETPARRGILAEAGKRKGMAPGVRKARQVCRDSNARLAGRNFSSNGHLYNLELLLQSLRINIKLC